MEINLDKKSATDASIKIKLNESDYQQEVEKKIKDYARKASIKGFRPGKVPPGMIRKMYGKSVLVEEVNQIVSKKLSDYVSENKLRILGNPLMNEEAMDPIDWDTEKEFTFIFDIGMVEEFEVKTDDSVKIKKYPIKITEEVINNSIKDIRNRSGKKVDTETPSEEDFITGEISLKDREPITTEISLKDADKTATKKFLKKKKDDKITVEIEKLFPNGAKEALQLDTEGEIKGKADVTIKNIQTLEPAEINQELFDQTFGKDAVKNEEEFTEKVKQTIADNYVNETNYMLNFNIRKELLNKTKIDLPEDFLKRTLKNNNEEITDEIIEQDFEKYKEQLKWDLIKGQLLQENEIKVENEDVKKKALKSMVGSMDIPESMMEQFNPVIDNYLSQNDGEAYRKIYEELQEEQLMAKLQEKLKITEKEVTIDEFTKIAEKEIK